VASRAPSEWAELRREALAAAQKRRKQVQLAPEARAASAAGLEHLGQMPVNRALALVAPSQLAVEEGEVLLLLASAHWLQLLLPAFCAERLCAIEAFLNPSICHLHHSFVDRVLY
jgi:hypothetical protein